MTRSFGGAASFPVITIFDGSGLWETSAVKVKYVGCKGGRFVLVVMVEWGGAVGGICV